MGRVPHKKRPKLEAFLAAIKRMPNVTAAARIAGINREQHYSRYRNDDEYRIAFDNAWELGIASIEDAVIERVMEGVPEPVVFKGRVCYERDEHGDLLYDDETGKPIKLVMQRHSVEREKLILRALRPDRYKDSLAVTGPGGKPVLDTLEVIFRPARPEEDEGHG